MSEVLKILLVTVTLAAVCTPILMWIFNKANFGKKETREEIEEMYFGRDK